MPVVFPSLLQYFLLTIVFLHAAYSLSFHFTLFIMPPFHLNPSLLFMLILFLHYYNSLTLEKFLLLQKYFSSFPFIKQYSFA